MAHVELTQELPGIVGLLDHYADTGRVLSELAQVLLRGGDGLTPGERELIATYVSSLNRCLFCTQSHAAAARQYVDRSVVDAVVRDRATAPVTPKLRALLAIAAKVQQGGRGVTDGDVAAARREGATDRDVHDAVLIAAAFCMYNRYVDGLATWAPEHPDAYDDIGRRLAEEGYVRVMEREPAAAAAT